ncbi:thioester reductase domain-containing protein, partial [Moorena sp. SIO4A1]|uniref:thioester reductase domain-containing protein n=1 Tax=Moorena sp. SIO4A1 TaxID=2607835 RepID=UPI00344D4C90
LRDLFESPTVAGVAQAIEKRHDSTQVTNQVRDLRAEVILDSKIQNQSVAFEYITEPKNIFLTGSTGFLGVYLLSELLEQTQGDIYCLVRATSSEQGKQRLQRALESYSLWNETKSSRIIPVIGELSAPLFGLDEPQFNHLASQVDVIYHNGAWVNFVYSYSILKPANVLGTHEVLRLASQAKIKPVHFISTISVFFSSAYSDKEVIFESDSLDYSPDNDDGYSESKWVAEKLVMEARDRNLPVCIYRPGRITGHSQTGFCNTEDLFSRMVKGCIQLGAVPNLEGVFSDIVPVDYVSKAIVNISQQKESLGKAFHMVNPNDIYVNEAFNMLCSWGYPIEKMDYEKWRTKLICQAENSNKNALYPLLPLFSEEFPVNAKMPRYDCKHTIHGLADTDIVCPSIDSKLLNTYYSYFQSSGFLNAPQ